MYLSEVISTWGILHQCDTGDIMFCDLVVALERAGVKITDDCTPVADEMEDLPMVEVALSKKKKCAYKAKV